MKTCSKCQVDKPLEAFHKCKTNADGLAYYCKECRAAAGQINKVHIAAQQKAWAVKNAPYVKETHAKYYAENKEKWLEYSRENREHIYAEKAKRNHRYIEKAKISKHEKYNSPEEVEKRKNITPEEREAKNKKAREYIARKRAEDPIFRLEKALRARVHGAIKKGYKSARTMILVGCTVDHIRAHLESKFTPEMNWNNYGIYWEVDHIRPCASFDLTDPAQQRACFNWINCQPLERIENRRKQDKYEGLMTDDNPSDLGVSQVNEPL